MARVREQLPLWERYESNGRTKAELRDAAAADNKALPVHRWVPWIAGFSAGFAQDAIDNHLPERGRDQALVLDPFAGVATTLVEALKARCNVVRFGINPVAVLAARARVNRVDVPVEAFKAEADAFRIALCYAHLKRDFQALVDRGGEAEPIGCWGLAELERLFALWHRCRAGEFDRKALQRRLVPLQARAERMLTVAATFRQQGRGLLDILVAAGEAMLQGTPAPSLLPAR